MRSPLHTLAAVAALLVSAAAQAVTVDLGAASQFSAITFGDFNGHSGDTGSLLGIGGNATLQNWTVNDYGLPGYAGYSLIVGGSFSGTSGKVIGSSHIGGTVATSAFDLGTSVGSGASPLNFEGLSTQLRNTSAATATAASTGTVDYAGGSTFLAGSNSNVEVFNIDGAQLSLDSYLASTSGIKSDATVILNISGKTVDMGSFGIDLANQSKDLNLLLNFYEATSLSFSNIAVEGAVLAPYAAVTGTSGHIGGTFIAQSFQSAGPGNFEFHDIDFTPVVIPSPVPEPAHWALLAMGLLFAPGVVRRASRISAPSPRPAAPCAPRSNRH